MVHIPCIGAQQGTLKNGDDDNDDDTFVCHGLHTVTGDDTMIGVAARRSSQP
jgi:hypothetical protein